MRLFIKKITLPLLILSILLLYPTSWAQASRIKEVSDFQGIRSNHLIGYGLVVGLDGKGDKSGTEFTTQSLVNMLNRFGVRVDPDDVTVKNVASVMVTADISPLDKTGSRLDVVVSSIGDAKTLQGGTLLFTPLNGADGEVYAVAQGSVSIGGFMGGGGGATVEKNFQTVGRVPGGALVEREVEIEYADEIFLTLKNPDFTTSKRIAGVINNATGKATALPLDASKVKLRIPAVYKFNQVEFLSMVESLDVPVDIISKVIVNERTGTIVIGENVKISKVAVSHGNLVVRVETEFIVSQPSPFGEGETVVTPKESVEIVEEESRLVVLEGGVKLGDLTGALNALGVTPRDLIAILQAIKAAGALQAELELI